MTIRKGEEWGLPLGAAALPATVARTDAEAAVGLWAQHQSPPPEPTGVRLLGGSLHDLLGRGSGEPRRYPVDLGVVTLPDGSERPFVASLVVRSRTGRHGTALMNTQTVGRLRLGHRSHPNDGRLDRVSWSLRTGELIEVIRRARLGAHTPHPGIAEGPVTDSCEVAVAARDRLLVDGVRVPCPQPSTLVVRIIADAGFVVV